MEMKFNSSQLPPPKQELLMAFGQLHLDELVCNDWLNNYTEIDWIHHNEVDL